ncbi:endonuclease domain-containing protein [Dongia sp.]|uniref:endonuclease domain-containing protein n=1 Tax=Dongia sp. TaxID=1977262 RepID=UPI0035B0288F
MPSRPADESVTTARRLRRDMTGAEKRLWAKLRDHQLEDAHFRRQFPVGPYVADFCCRQAKLIVEVDGSQHADTARDDARTAYLQTLGYRVLRFWNNDVLTNIEGVVETIRESLRLHPHPDPPPEGRGD